MLFCIFSICLMFCMYEVGYFSACKEYKRGVNHPVKFMVFWTVLGIASLIGIFSLYFEL